MIRTWLRNWLGITAIEARKVLKDGEDDPALKRIALLEFELAKQEQQHAADIAELRERLDNRVSRGTPHRSFQMMRKVAEMGEAMQKEKNAG